MKLTKENVEQIINRFMNGETSNEEETALFKFFQNEVVPEHLRVYKPMFAYLAGGMKDEDLPGKNKSSEVVSIETASKSMRLSGYWRRFIIPLAAGVAACFIGVAVFTHYEQRQNLYNSYSGSYVIDHGRRLSDIHVIMPTLKSIEAQADQAEAQHQAAQITHNVLKDISDPAVRAAAAEALK